MNDNGDWLRQMADLQQQYWRGWQNMAGQAFAPPQAARTPWQEGLDLWARSFGGGATAASSPGMGVDDVGGRLLAYGRQYLDMLQQMAGGKGFAAGPTFDPRAWIDEMRAQHERMGRNVLNAGTGAMPWFGGIDPAQVEQLVRAFTAAPAHGMQNEMRGFFDLPAFGLAREHQERGQALAQAWIDYQAATARYNELMLKTATRTLDLLEGKFAERERPGRQIESARALYDLWIDAAEDAFAEIAMSPEYRTVYGELVNGQMRVRAGINGELERFAAQFGMPTRTEVDSLARQLHELRRELRRRNASGSEGGTSSRATNESAGKARPTPRAAATSKSAQRGERTKKPSGSAAPAGARSSATRSTQRTAAPAKSAPRPGARKAQNRHGDDAPMIQSTARKNAGAR